MNLSAIKSAVESGKRVYWHHEGYEVINDSLGQWFIKCVMNGHCIGLTWQDGITMNGKPKEFYIV